MKVYIALEIFNEEKLTEDLATEICVSFSKLDGTPITGKEYEWTVFDKFEGRLGNSLTGYEISERITQGKLA